MSNNTRLLLSFRPAACVPGTTDTPLDHKETQTFNLIYCWTSTQINKG